MAERLIADGQDHLFAEWDAPGICDQEKEDFLATLRTANASYPGGIAAYTANARVLLAGAVTGGNPFGAMMQAWKYALPAFLVPFLFSASPEGANLLIIDATLPGFILATVSSSIALFLLSLGIVGYFRGPVNVLERALLILLACFMVLDPLELTLWGLAPTAVGAAMVTRHVLAFRRKDAHTPAPA